MRLLFHSGDATYDSTTKQYHFSLDRRIDHPKSIRIIKCIYRAATSTSYPLSLYVRSDALHRIIKEKHTLRVKNQNHEQTENILCSLLEDDRIGFYKTHEVARELETDNHQVLKDIDLYFTNNTVLFPGVPTGTSDGLADITAQAEAGNVIFYTDMDYGLLDTSGNPITTSGTHIGSIQARYPVDGSVTFTRNSGGELVFGDFNDNTKSFTQNDTAAWDYFYDSSVSNVPDSGSLFILYKTDDSVSNYERLAKFDALFDVVLMSSGAGAKVSMRDVTNTYHTILENIVAEKAYLLEVQWAKTGDSGNTNTVDYTVKATRLDLDTTTNGSLTGIVVGPNTSDNMYWGGNAQFHADGIYSDMIMTNTDSTARAKAESYLKTKFNGTGPDPNGTNAEWLLEVEIKQ